MKYGKCPTCKNEVELDYTPEYNDVKPYERCCFFCGWFDSVRYATEIDAKIASGNSNA